MRILDIGELLLLAAVWGSSFLFMRIAAPAIGPVWLIEIRVLLAGLVLLPFLVRLGLLNDVRRKLIPLVVVGCFNSTIPFLLLAFASLSLSAGFISVLNAMSPLFGLVIASIWLKEKLTVVQMVGFALGFAGVVVLIGWQTVVATPSFLMSVGAGLLAALMYAIAALYAKQQLAGVPSLAVATGSQLGAAVFIVPAMPFAVPNTIPTAAVILSVLALALLSTSLAYILYFRLITNIGATKALTVAYLIPLFAILSGAAVLQEPITGPMIVGCGLILLGTAIANDLLTSLLHSNAKN